MQPSDSPSILTPSPHPDDTTVRLQLGPHPNPWFTFRVIILSTRANGARRVVQCKHADLYFVFLQSFDDTYWWVIGSGGQGSGWHEVDPQLVWPFVWVFDWNVRSLVVFYPSIESLAREPCNSEVKILAESTVFTILSNFFFWKNM